MTCSEILTPFFTKEISSFFWNWHPSIVNPWNVRSDFIYVENFDTLQHITSYVIWIFTSPIRVLYLFLFTIGTNKSDCFFRLPSQWLLSRINGTSSYLVIATSTMIVENSCTRIATVCKIIDRFDQWLSVSRSNEWIVAGNRIKSRPNWLFNWWYFPLKLKISLDYRHRNGFNRVGNLHLTSLNILDPFRIKV